MRQAAERAGRDPDALELTLGGYLPTVTEESVEEARALGATRMVVSTSITRDLGAVRDETAAFAERFGLAGAAGGTA